MSSMNPTTAIIPIDLGTVGAFDQNIFPLEYYVDSGDNLSKGTFLISATLDEMEKIRELGVELLNKNDDFVFNTRLKIEALRVQKAKLQDNRKTLNPFKAFMNYRTARLFHAASRSLYLQTKSTSEKMHRENGGVQVVPSTQLRLVNDAISPDAGIAGLSITLPDGLNDSAKQMISDATRAFATMDPFQDNFLASQLRDDEHAITLAETASVFSQDVRSSAVDGGNRTSVASGDPQSSHLTSPQTINHIHYTLVQNSIVAANSSNLNGLTANSGEQNSGASVTQQSLP